MHTLDENWGLKRNKNKAYSLYKGFLRNLNHQKVTEFFRGRMPHSLFFKENEPYYLTRCNTSLGRETKLKSCK